MRFIFALLVAALSLPLPIHAASWVKLQASQVELLTDAGERAGRDALNRLLQLRGMFQEPHGGRKLQIILFSSKRDFQELAPAGTADGVYYSGPGYDFILMYAGGELGRVAAHEYIHFLLNQSSTTRPLWFEEGTAELYSTYSVRGAKLSIGAPIQPHVELLSSRKWLTAGELSAVTGTSTLFNERNHAGLFYAQSWALVHLLNFSQRYRNNLPRFIELLDGKDAASAFEEAFGRTLTEAINDAQEHYRRAREVTVDAPISINETIPHEPISDVDGLLLRVTLGLRTGHPEVARKWLERAAQTSPSSPEVATQRAMLALYDGDRKGGRARLQQALQANSRDATLWFELAMVERELDAPRDRVRELLRKTAEIDPSFGEAQFLLGVEATDLGHFNEAITRLQEAARDQPRRSSVWYALAFALERNGNLAAAGQAAARAQRTASTREEESMARALLDSMDIH